MVPEIRFFQTNRRLFLFGLFFVGVLLAMRASLYDSYVWKNFGFARLNEGFVHSDSAAASQAEMLLRRSIIEIGKPRASWRGLGWALSLQEHQRDAIVAWQTAGGMAEEFIVRGHQYRADGQYLIAIELYEKAIQIDRQTADPWYFIGLSYEGLGLWEQAVDTFQRGGELSATKIGSSDFLYQVGWLQAHKLQPIDLAGALTNLDLALAQNQFAGSFQRSDALFQRADVLRRLDQPKEAFAGYQAVVALAPDNYWAWAYSGHLLRTELDDLVKAEAILLHAVEINSQIKYAYFELGALYQEMKQITKAEQAYQHILEVDAADQRALHALQTLENGG